MTVNYSYEPFFVLISDNGAVERDKVKRKGKIEKLGSFSHFLKRFYIVFPSSINIKHPEKTQIKYIMKNVRYFVIKESGLGYEKICGGKICPCLERRETVFWL